MIYKINTEKKDEFVKWNYKQLLKNQLPIYTPFLIIADIIMLIVFPIGFADIKSLIPFIILATNIIFIFVYFVFSFLGVKISSKKFVPLVVPNNFLIVYGVNPIPDNLLQTSWNF